MNRNTLTILAIAFGFLAGTFFMAPSFGILAQNVGVFLGIVSGAIAGFGWSIRGRFN
jgi:hypothetical protein